MSEPVLDVDVPDGQVSAVALVLHGGRSTSRRPVQPTQLAVLRMLPFVADLRRLGGPGGLAVARLRYRVRGWNGADASPVPDTLGALDDLAARFPGTPVGLLGHSMGGRAAIYAAGHPAVHTVVGLAPWLEPGDPYRQLADRTLLTVHGDRDRMTSPSESAAFTRRAADVATVASYVSVRGSTHPMLRRARTWQRLGSGLLLGSLLGLPATGTGTDEIANTITKALSGDALCSV